MPKIFVAGDFNLDLVVFLDQLPKVGETLNANRFLEGAGGKGSNQAIAIARLGAEVTFFGAIGDDYYGQVAQDTWRDNAVNTDYVVIDSESQTGLALINVDAEGNNTIAVAQGANLQLTLPHVDRARDAIRDADVVMCTLGIAPDIVHRVLQIANQAGTTTILNPAPAMSLPQDTLSLVDILTPNQGELAVLTGNSDVSLSIEEQARQLLSRDTQTVIVTLGAEGAQWITTSDSEHIPTHKVDVVDTVGAGDAFNAGLAVALAEGQSLTEAIEFANAVGALSVQKEGAVAGMPSRDAVEQLLPN
ncbi:MAG: ribokinase [Chloroflexota bacterium]